MKVLQRTLIVLVSVVMVLGALLVLSASGSYTSFYGMFKTHIWKVMAAGILMAVAAMIPYDFYKKYSKHAILAILFLLFITLLVAPKVKGATRWLNLGFMQFQPSELAKLILIVHLANLIEKKGELLKSFNEGYRYVVVWIFSVAGLVLLQPNVSTCLIIVMIGFTILFIAGAKLKHIAATLGLAAFLAGGVMMLFAHSRERILSFFNSVNNGGEINLQVLQAKIALGSGGLWGLGLGESKQSAGFLPESKGDFIFSILGEEFGFIGTVSVLLIFFVIFLIGIIIARKSEDRFAQLTAIGISFNILISAFINAGVVSGILPTTGITFPFLSFGGTSIMLFAVSIGILLSISRRILKDRKINSKAEPNKNRTKAASAAV